MRTSLISVSLVLAPLLCGCGNEVPIGSGKSDVNGTGGQAGAAGRSNVGGNGGASGSGGASGGAGGSGGASGGAGGSGGASGGAGGSGGTSGSGGASGSGGGTGQCPETTASVQNIFSVTSPRDTLIVGTTLYVTETSTVNDTIITRIQLPSGTPEPFSSKTLNPGQAEAYEAADSLVSDGTDLYWRANSGNQIWKQSLTGGAPVLVSSVQPAVFPGQYGTSDMLAISGGKLYWAQGPEPLLDPGNNAEYAIYEAPITGGAAQKRGAFQSDSQAIDPFVPTSLRADASNLFFTLTGPSSYSLYSMPLALGAPTKLQAAGSWLDLVGSDVLVTAGPFLMRSAKTGGAPTTLWTGLDPNQYDLLPQSVVVGGGTAYASYMAWVFSGSSVISGCGVVLSAPSDGQNVTPKILWQGTGRPFALSYSPTAIAAVDLDSDRVILLDP